MNRGTKALCLAAFLLLGSGAFQPAGSAALRPDAEGLGPVTAELLKLPVTAQAYPEDDVVILYRGVEVRLDSAGRVSRRVRLVQRLLTDLAIAHGGDPRVPYDTTRQELSIHTCRTFMLDGKEVRALPRAFNRVTPDRVAPCPDRAALQEMVISYLGVERGCLTELDYTVADRTPFRPWCEGREEIGAAGPILQGDVVLRVPPGTALRSRILGDLSPTAIPSDSTGEGRAWRLGPVAPFPDEGGLPDLARVPCLVFSTCPDWETLLHDTQARLEEAGIADSAIAAWIREPLASGRVALNDEERLERAAWLIRERTASGEDSPLSWYLPIRPSARAFDSSCGNLLDRAALAHAALSAWGMRPRVYLRPSTGNLAREIPALVQFDDVWLRTGSRFLSIAEGTSGPRPDAGQAEELLCLQDGRARFEPLPARRGSSALSLLLRQGEDGSISGEASIRVGGALCRRLDCQDLKGFLEGLAADYLDGGEPEGYRVEALSADTLAVTFSLKGKGLGDSLGSGRRRLTLPSAPGMPDGALSDGINFRRLERSTSLLLPCVCKEEVRLRLELAGALHSVILPSPARVEGAGGTLDLTVERDGEAVILHRRFATTRRRIAPAEYPSFRSLWLRRTEAPANAVYLQESRRASSQHRS